MIYFSGTSPTNANLNVTLDTTGGFLHGIATAGFKTGAVSNDKVSGEPIRAVPGRWLAFPLEDVVGQLADRGEVNVLVGDTQVPLDFCFFDHVGELQRADTEPGE